MESTDDLGYRYSNWCIFIPPFRIWDLIAVKIIDPWMIRSLRSARLVIRSSRMVAETVEFRVFINQPRASHRSKVDDNAAFAGSIAAFGMGEMAMESKSTSESFDLEINVTEQARSSLAEDPEELKLKIVALDTNGEAVDADRLTSMRWR